MVRARRKISEDEEHPGGKESEAETEDAERCRGRLLAAQEAATQHVHDSISLQPRG